MKTDERMRNLVVNSERSAEFFLGDEYHEACEIARNISKKADKNHEINCPNDDECHGITPYILQGMKEYFIDHPELKELERLAISSELFHFIGSTTMEQRMEMKDIEEDEAGQHIRDILGSIPGSIEDIDPEPDDNDKD